ncbi:Xyloglucanase [Arachnomyces sp. PD_36]|nr:Xyloglucanase [Arachnomyces sp. PD_36]
MAILSFLPKLALAAAALPLAATAQEGYTWENVHFGGGGGFVPGIIFSQAKEGVAYARTDIGGLYRLNPDDDSWTPLTDFIASNAEWHNWGIDAVAADPTDADRVYAAVGLYTNDWDPTNGSIISSADGGETWTFTDLPFKVGGNMPGRGMGERLAVDPNNNEIIYFGARSGNGLWKSTDQGATFTQVESFTAVGEYIADPSDTTGLNSDIQGLAFIEFDTTSDLLDGATSRIFVGTADKAASVFVSEDAGETWEAVPGQPTGFLPHKCRLSPDEQVLYLTYSNTSGPYDGGNGTIQRYDLVDNTWTDITPVSGADLAFGFGGLAVDLLNPGTIMAATLNLWWPDAQLYRSNDSGATWSTIWEWTAYPEKNLYYDMSTPKAPWITSHRAADDTKELGWMIESLEINPFDSDHWLYGTGLTIYGGHDLTNWDTVHNVTIQSLADGIEETAVLDLASAESGASLMAAVGDVGGFTFNETLTEVPKDAWTNPLFASNSGVDYAGNKPNAVVRVGTDPAGTASQIAVSEYWASSWSVYAGDAAGYYGGKVAYSADADTILWSTEVAGVVVSSNEKAFNEVASLPAAAKIASDKKNGTVFYAGSGAQFFVSTDSGATFQNSSATLGASKTINDIEVNPAIAGDVWVSTDAGVFHTTDFGSTFTKTSGDGISDVYAIALGKGANDYWNVYAFLTSGELSSLHVSTDVGKTWTDIQGERGFGTVSGAALAANKNEAGLVFVGTNGRGVFYGTPA